MVCLSRVEARSIVPTKTHANPRKVKHRHIPMRRTHAPYSCKHHELRSHPLLRLPPACPSVDERATQSAASSAVAKQPSRTLLPPRVTCAW